jgi:hypothetical protein
MCKVPKVETRVCQAENQEMGSVCIVLKDLWKILIGVSQALGGPVFAYKSIHRFLTFHALVRAYLFKYASLNLIIISMPLCSK